MQGEELEAATGLKFYGTYECQDCGAYFGYPTGRDRPPQRPAGLQPDYHPCPTCGAMQPQMLAQRRMFYQLIWTLPGCAAAFWIALLAGQHSVPVTTGLLLTAAVVLVNFAGHFAILALTIYGDRHQNIADAERCISQGWLYLIQPGRTSGFTIEESSGGDLPPAKKYLPLGVLLLLLAVAALPEAVRSATQWPYNRGFYPPVVSSGNQVALYPGETVTSVKGLWNGTVQGEIVNAEELGLKTAEVEAKTKTSTWHDEIRVGYAELYDQESRLWIKVAVPDEPRLAHQKVQLLLDATIRYPARTDPMFYDDLERRLQFREELKVAPSGAGWCYSVLWFLAQFVVPGVLILVNVWIVRLSVLRGGW